MSKVERNQIFSAIEAGGLNPRDCAWEGFDKDDGFSEFTHRPTGATFTLWRKAAQPDKYDAQWNVETVADYQHAKNYGWSRVPDFVKRWAELVVENEALPDLWAELARSREVLEAAETAGNAPFTTDEQDDIGLRLDAVKQLVQERFDLSDEHMAALTAGIEEVKRASTRLGRKDWLMFVSGAALNLIVSAEVPPRAVQTLLDLAVRGVAHLFGVGSPPPMLLA
jgi:hypothetical protein